MTELFWNPPSAASDSTGKNAARATPMPALSAATRRSAAATSGRRCSKVDGTPTGLGRAVPPGDDEAFAEFERAVAEEGMRTFLDKENVIPFRR